MSDKHHTWYISRQDIHSSSLSPAGFYYFSTAAVMLEVLSSSCWRRRCCKQMCFLTLFTDIHHRSGAFAAGGELPAASYKLSESLTYPPCLALSHTPATCGQWLRSSFTLLCILSTQNYSTDFWIPYVFFCSVNQFPVTADASCPFTETPYIDTSLTVSLDVTKRWCWAVNTHIKHPNDHYLQSKCEMGLRPEAPGELVPNHLQSCTRPDDKICC